MLDLPLPLRLLVVGVSALVFAFVPAESWAQDAGSYTLYGTVTDDQGTPLVNATVHAAPHRVAVTDTTGYYALRLPREPRSSALEVEVRYVGKRPHRARVQIPAGARRWRHDVVLSDLNLYMDEVTVTAERARESVSVSSYVIDRIAIEQAQAYTLGGLLQLIPGQSITNPSLQGAQTINLRTAATGPYSRNNAFGIGLYLNGQALNNNADLQGLNPVDVVPLRSLEGGRFEGRRYTSGDTPGGGFDLRELPVGTIERVEVVQGVASAEYGDLLDGGIFIETAAGPSPWNVTLRRSGGEFSAGVNKGFRLSPRHALQASVDYLNSNDDPRDRVKTFNRLSTSLLWTAYFGADRRVRNTLSLSYRTNLDDFKIDPDFDSYKRVYYQDRRVAFSNRLRVQASWPLFDTMTLTTSGSMGRSTSLLDEYVNPGVRPVTGVMDEGVATGTFHPPNYRSDRRILGQPLSLSARLQLERSAPVSDWTVHIAYGGSFRFDANYGEGRLFDPLRPVPLNVSSDRPVSFEAIRPELLQGGAFLETTLSGTLGGHELTSALGMRADVQHGYSTLSPRINTRFHLTDHVALTGAYGLQVKAPGLIHLYPGPTYRDYTLLNSYTGRLDESVYLTYTHIEQDVAQGVQPMRSRRMEVGAEWRAHGASLSATLYRNVTGNGITVQRRPEFLDLPVYEIAGRHPDGTPRVVDTGTTRRVVYDQGYVTNGLYTRNWGAELTATTPRIEALQTSFALNLTYTSSYYYDRTLSFSDNDPVGQPGDAIRFGIYPNTERQSGRLQGLLTSMHHISELGLLVTLRSEAFLYTYSKILGRSNRAVAYVNSDAEIVPIADEEVDDPRFDVLDRAPVEGTFSHYPPFAYFNIHANVSKNIGEAVRLSFFANNVFNLRPQVREADGTRTRLNQPPYVGMELRITL